MIDQKSSATAHPATPEPAPGYVLRGLGIYELHAGVGAYEVRVGTRPERNRCECRGFSSHKHCSHVVAAGRVARRSAVCDGCGARTWRRDLSEVQKSLTYFEGDLLCPTCRYGSDADVL